MNLVVILLIIILCIGIGILLLMKWAFKPEKCPKCGTMMPFHYDAKKDMIWYKCPNCGNVIYI